MEVTILVILSVFIVIIITINVINSCIDYKRLKQYRVLDLDLDFNDFDGNLYYIGVDELLNKNPTIHITKEFVFNRNKKLDPFSNTFGLTFLKYNECIISTSPELVESMINDYREKALEGFKIDYITYKFSYDGSESIDTDKGKVDPNEYEDILWYNPFDNTLNIDNRIYKIKKR